MECTFCTLFYCKTIKNDGNDEGEGHARIT